MTDSSSLHKSFVLTEKRGDTVKVYVYNLARNFEENQFIKDKDEFESYSVDENNVSNKSFVKYEDIIVEVQGGSRSLVKDKVSKSKKKYFKLKAKTIKKR